MVVSRTLIQRINLLDVWIFITNSTRFFLLDRLTNISNEEIFFQDFPVILKFRLQNYKKIMKKCFFCTTWTVTGLNV